MTRDIGKTVVIFPAQERLGIKRGRHRVQIGRLRGPAQRGFCKRCAARKVQAERTARRQSCPLSEVSEVDAFGFACTVSLYVRDLLLPRPIAKIAWVELFGQNIQ